MALFNRRPKDDGAETPDEVAEAAPDQTAVTLPAEGVPEVGISFSTYGKAATVPSVTRPPAEAPPRTQTVPGMPDNVILKNALAAVPDKPQNIDVMNVMRQALQGHLFVRVQGDAKALLAEGKPLTLAVTVIDDKRFLLAFSGGAALQDSVRSDGDAATSAVGQPAATVFQNVLAGPYAGLSLDHATKGARLILPTELIAKALEEGDPAFTLKTLLVTERTDKTAIDVAEALTRVKVWVAGNADPSGRIGLAEARTADGQRRLELFSHPLEVIAMGRGDRPLPLTGEQLGKALAADDGITGVIVDPAGPWIELGRTELSPVIALA